MRRGPHLKLDLFLELKFITLLALYAELLS